MHIKQALLHNTGWKILTMLFTFVNNLLIVYTLGAVMSGSFFYALSIFTLLSIILRFGLENGIIYVCSKYPKSTNAVTSFLLIVVFFQIFITYFVIKYFINVPISLNLLWATLFVLNNILLLYVSAFYQVKKRFISLNVSTTVFVVVQCLALMIYYFTKNNNDPASDVNFLMMTIALSSFINILFLAGYIYLKEKTDFSKLVFNKTTNTQLLKFSLLNFLCGVLLFLIMRTDLFFVEKYCSSIILANYIQIIKIGQIILVFPGQISGVLFPYTVNSEAFFEEKISFFLRICNAVFAILFMLFLLLGKLVILSLFNKDFDYMFLGLCGTLPGVYFFTLNLIIISYFEGKNLQKNMLFSYFLILLIIVLGDFYFVPIYGYMAAAIIFSIANLMGLLLSIYYFQKHTNLSLKQIFKFRKTDFDLLIPKL
jgi:O-antigen/teichoic acid export membrane protein